MKAFEIADYTALQADARKCVNDLKDSKVVHQVRNSFPVNS
jgi:hypothetical protein